MDGPPESVVSVTEASFGIEILPLSPVSFIASAAGEPIAGTKSWPERLIKSTTSWPGPAFPSHAWMGLESLSCAEGSAVMLSRKI